MTQYPQDPNQPHEHQRGPINQGPPPQRNAPKKRHTGRNAAIIAGSILGGLVLIGVLSPSDPAKEAADKIPNVVTTTTAPPTKASLAPTQPPTTTAPPKTTAPAPVVETTTEAPEVAEPSLTTSQEQAIGTAEDYLRGQSFSRKGLIEQLVYEGFSAKDATFGVDQLKMDWGSQAIEVAKNYLNGQHFSRTGLIEQLEFEGFTHKQAVYGVTKAGL